MKTIREIALEVAKDYAGYLGHVNVSCVQEFAESVLAEYLAQQEPFGYYWNFQNKEDGFIRLDEMTGRRPMKDWMPCFLAPPITAGMQLVPVEPTEAMIKSASKYGGPINIYKAMLAAAKESSHAE